MKTVTVKPCKLAFWVKDNTETLSSWLQWGLSCAERSIFRPFQGQLGPQIHLFISECAATPCGHFSIQLLAALFFHYLKNHQIDVFARHFAFIPLHRRGNGSSCDWAEVSQAYGDKCPPGMLAMETRAQEAGRGRPLWALFGGTARWWWDFKVLSQRLTPSCAAALCWPLHVPPSSPPPTPPPSAPQIQAAETWWKDQGKQVKPGKLCLGITSSLRRWIWGLVT